MSDPAARYSEDIDLVQTEPGAIGPALNAIRARLDGWLGKPRWKQSEGRVTLSYRFQAEDLPPVRLKLKVEINSREHFTVYGVKDHRFEVRSRWFSGAANVRTYELDELLGTKLRALYQRKKDETCSISRWRCSGRRPHPTAFSKPLLVTRTRVEYGSRRRCSSRTWRQSEQTRSSPRT
jgi:hypothetical protein